MNLEISRIFLETLHPISVNIAVFFVLKQTTPLLIVRIKRIEYNNYNIKNFLFHKNRLLAKNMNFPNILFTLPFKDSTL